MRKLENNAQMITAEGWCVMNDIIPEPAIVAIRNSLFERQRIEREAWEQVREQWKAAGQLVPDSQVGLVQGVLNSAPEAAEFFTDERVISVAEAFFGPNVRISGISGIITAPGNGRGNWHADWPFNQGMAARIAAPYQDAVMHLSGIVMLSDFTVENGATFILPGTHRRSSNPTGDIGVDRYAMIPGEMQVTGRACTMLLYDSRLWHAAAANRSADVRLAITVRYAPWWLNLEVRRSGSADHRRIVQRGKGKDNAVPPIPRELFERFSERAKPFFEHNVSD